MPALQESDATYGNLRYAIRHKVDKPPVFSDKVASDGRLNAEKALAAIGGPWTERTRDRASWEQGSVNRTSIGRETPIASKRPDPQGMPMSSPAVSGPKGKGPDDNRRSSLRR